MLQIYKHAHFSIFGEYKKKLNHVGLRAHSKNLSWMFFARIGTMIISFLSTAFIARTLGPSNYGQLSYAISFSSLFVFIASLGLDQILYRDLVNEPEKKNSLLGNAVIIRMGTSLLAASITTIVASLFSKEDVSLLLIFIISLSPFFGAFQLIGYEFQSKRDSKYPSILSIFLVFILNITKVVIVYLGFGIIYLSLVILLEPILYSIGYVYLKKQIYKDCISFKVDSYLISRLIKDSIPLMFAASFYAIHMRIDQVILKNMIDSHAVGIYDAAVRISELSYFIPSTILMALSPSILQAKKISESFYIKRLRQLAFVIILSAIIPAAITAFLSKFLILTIYGKDFLEALPILTIYTWSNIGAAITMYLQQILITENRLRLIVISVLIAAIVNIIFNIILIPKHGPEGAAFATLISYTIPMFSLFLFKDTRTLLLKLFK